MVSYRKRLLLSTVTTLLGTVALIAPQAASAQCVTAAGTRTCGNTSTTDTTGNGPVDRNGLYDTSVGNAAVIVNGNVTTFGLAASPSASGANTRPSPTRFLSRFARVTATGGWLGGVQHQRGWRDERRLRRHRLGQAQRACNGLEFIMGGSAR